MEFTYLGKALDINKQHELFTKKTFGVNAKVTLNDGTIIHHNNCVEIHYKYPPFKDSIAFESDIHKAGNTIVISRIKSIIVEVATEISDTF